jgi:hypothetical protein
MKKINEVKKELLRSKVKATFQYCAMGKLYYQILLSDGAYNFPVNVFDHGPHGLRLSEAMGTTHFPPVIKASELNRWIEKAIENDEFTQAVYKGELEIIRPVSV